ncbi:LGFP repeat-containing protein [Gordonia phosphorivorans]|uniref:LGFP repeat-containing protein n=1 Tax=Gordonia phosphorivorans TaxID=1056982 RepID=A0ABV6H9A3_9ACTN
MKKIVHRKTAGIIAGLAAVTLVAAGCSSDNSKELTASTTSVVASAASSAVDDGADAGKVELKAADGSTVTLTGPIAAKYSAASEAQKTDLGQPLTGDDASGTSDSGVVYQQFDGGVITARNGDAGTPAYITWGKIRDAWNVERDAQGEPSDDGEEGSDGPLGAATSDETTEGDIKKSTFENGTITWNSADDTVTVTVNGKVVKTD